MTKFSRRDAIKLTATATATLPLLAGAAQAATHNVTIKSFMFDPADLTIAAGDSVIFTNEDGAPHTATDVNGAFDTGRLNRGGSATLTFAGAGAFEYFCEFHPNMKGKITIT